MKLPTVFNDMKTRNEQNRERAPGGDQEIMLQC